MSPEAAPQDPQDARAPKASAHTQSANPDANQDANPDANPDAEAPQHPRHELSDVLHQPVRFSIAAALSKTETMDFKDLRNTIQVSDSVLSKQLSHLEKAGFVTIKKGFVGKFPRTSVSLSADGQQAWDHHIATLRLIAGG